MTDVKNDLLNKPSLNSLWVTATVTVKCKCEMLDVKFKLVLLTGIYYISSMKTYSILLCFSVPYRGKGHRLWKICCECVPPKRKKWGSDVKALFSSVLLLNTNSDWPDTHTINLSLNLILLQTMTHSNNVLHIAMSKLSTTLSMNDYLIKSKVLHMFVFVLCKPKQTTRFVLQEVNLDAPSHKYLELVPWIRPPNCPGLWSHKYNTMLFVTQNITSPLGL